MFTSLRDVNCTPKFDKSASNKELTFSTPDKSLTTSGLKSPFSLSSLGVSFFKIPHKLIIEIKIDITKSRNNDTKSRYVDGLVEQINAVKVKQANSTFSQHAYKLTEISLRTQII